MGNISIKVRLIIVAIVSLLGLSGVITVLALNTSTNSLLESEFNKLSTLEAAKSGEIKNYFDALEGLLTSLANHQGTKESFSAFEDGFYKLQDELKLDIPKIKTELKSDFESNYLNDVNYDIPNSAQRRNINDYLPSDTNALVAQYIFITDNSSKLGEKNEMVFNGKYKSTYMRAHKKYHKTFDKFLDSFELYDIFMVDLKGNLIYTDFKEKDYATNLKNGVYSQTGIARAYKKALTLEEGKLAFDDFVPYEPSYNSAASFIATPIFIEGVKKGVLIFQMPVDRINSIMSFSGKYEDAGLGQSGESYLIGPDYKMRNNSRFTKDIKDPIIQKLGSTIGVWEVKTDSTKSVMSENNKKGKWIIDDYRGVSVLSAYDTIELFGQTKWAIVAEIDEAEALEPANELRNIVIVSAVIIVIIAILVFLFFINNIVAKPLSRLNEGILNLLHSNDTSSRVNLKSNDEIGKIANHFNEYLQTIENGLQEDKRVIDNVSLIVKEVSQGSLSKRVTVKTSNNTVQELVNVLNNMMQSLQEIIIHSLQTLQSYEKHDYRAKTTIKCTGEVCDLMNGIDNLGTSISDMLVDNTKNGLSLDNSAQMLLKNVDSLNIESTHAAASLEETAAAIEEITSSIRENTNSIVKMSHSSTDLTKASKEGQDLATKTTSAMDEINQQVESINDAISVIDQISFQTNILSLNAAVEAATAGEAGKGFAVVAQEVRNLASRSAEAAREIKTLVENATLKANEGKNIADKMIVGYKKLNENINSNINLISDIELASKEQSKGMEQINDSINSLDQQTQRNVSIANNTHEISIQTSNIAKKIVSGANDKEFVGKNSIPTSPSQSTEICLTNTNRNDCKKVVVKQANKEIYLNKGEENWESF